MTIKHYNINKISAESMMGRTSGGNNQKIPIMGGAVFPQNTTWKSEPPGPKNVTLFGNKSHCRGN